MKNTVKEDWKRRIYAAFALLLVMLVIMALWRYGRSFAKVLQIGSEDVGRIVVVRRGTSDLEITDRETIDTLMSIINHFRYQAYYDRSNISGCLSERYMTLYSQEGRELSRLTFTDQSVMLYSNDAYLSSTPYFEPLCRELHLKTV